MSTGRYDLLQTRLNRLTRMLRRVERDNREAVHPARVAARRLRELLPVLQLEAATSRKIGSRLRKMARRLGKLRDLDVMALILEDMRGSMTPGVRHAATRVENDLRQRRDQRKSRVLTKKAVADGRRAAHRLGAVLEQINASEDSASAVRAVRWAVRARVARRAATLKQGIGTAGAVYLPERLHEVRIAVKKLRYGAELALEAGGSVSAADVRVLERAQGVLGRLNDLQTLVDRVRRVQGSLTPPDVKAWRELGALVLLIETRCRRVHARYIRERESLLTLCDRLGGRPTAATARRKVS